MQDARGYTSKTRGRIGGQHRVESGQVIRAWPSISVQSHCLCGTYDDSLGVIVSYRSGYLQGILDMLLGF